MYFYVEMSPNCSILTSIYQHFPGRGGMPSNPLVPACFAHLHPRNEYLELAPPSPYKS